MAITSIIKFSKLQSSKRIDAQFYTPEIVRIRKLLEKSPNLLNKAKKITDFGAYSQTNFVKYRPKGIRFLRNQNVREVLIDDTDLVFIDEEVYEKLSLKLEENDVVTPRAGTLGNSGVITKGILPCSANQNLAQIKPKDDLSPYYLSVFYPLSTDCYKHSP